MAISQSIYTDIFNPTDDAAISITSGGYYRIASGAYTSLSITTDEGTEIDIEPGVTFSTTWTLDGDNTSLTADPSLSVNGLTTVSASKVSINGANSGTLAGISITGGGQFFSLDGGGSGFNVSVTDSGVSAIVNLAADVLIKNCSFKTVGGTGGAGDGLGNQQARVTLFNTTIVDSDDDGINNTAADLSFLNSFILDTDDYLIASTGARFIAFGNNLVSGSQNGVWIVGSNADNCIINSNVIQATTSSVIIAAAANSGNMVTGNRIEIAVSDSGTSSTVANNNVATI